MSTRQLERLFRRYLNRSPKRYYMELRLQKARNLLMQTDMSVINVALACGFASPVAFLEMLPRALQDHALPRARRHALGLGGKRAGHGHENGEDGG
jgi:transcriptional regulator GlxA family with amidase domain